VYYTKDIMNAPVVMIEGKCEVTTKDDLLIKIFYWWLSMPFTVNIYMIFILELSSRLDIA
jgi:hypothetical protein